MKRALGVRAVVVGLVSIALVVGQAPLARSDSAMDDARMTQMMKMMAEVQEQMKGMREQMQGTGPMHGRMDHMMGEMGRMRAMMEQHRSQMQRQCPAAGPAQPPAPPK